MCSIFFRITNKSHAPDFMEIVNLGHPAHFKVEIVFSANFDYLHIIYSEMFKHIAKKIAFIFSLD